MQNLIDITNKQLELLFFNFVCSQNKTFNIEILQTLETKHVKNHTEN